MRLDTITKAELSPKELKEAISEYAGKANAGEHVFDPDTAKIWYNGEIIDISRLEITVST